MRQGDVEKRALDAMKSIAAASELAGGTNDRFGLFMRSVMSSTEAGSSKLRRRAQLTSRGMGRLFAPMSPPFKGGTRYYASVAGDHSVHSGDKAGGRNLQAVYGDRVFDLGTQSGRNSIFLDGYLSCWLPPTRLCILQRFAARNATAGVDLSRLAPCCSERRVIRGPDPATIFDVPADLFNPSCECGFEVGDAYRGSAATANLTDEEVWARLASTWFQFATE